MLGGARTPAEVACHARAELHAKSVGAIGVEHSPNRGFECIEVGRAQFQRRPSDGKDDAKILGVEGAQLGPYMHHGIPPLFRTLPLGANMAQEVFHGTSFVHPGVQAGGGSVSA